MKTTINLIDVQPEIARRADELYKDKRFVGIVLSTGGGKSFLAMDRIIKQANEYNARVGFEDNDPYVLSNCPMLYFSPTHIVNGQFRTHMTKYIIAPEYLKKDIEEHGDLTRENAEDALKRILSKFKIMPEDEEYAKIQEKLKNKINNEAELEKAVLSVLRDVLESAPSDSKKEIVKAAFPALTFMAYKSVEKIDNSNRREFEAEYEESLDDDEQKQDISDINKIKPELIIFDEAHRTGAKKWWPKIQSFIKGHKKTKVLAITATPERDVDEQNMMKELAAIEEMGYTVRERREKKYLAGNYPLMEALKLGLVNPPEVVHFNMTLDETQEFREMLTRFVKTYIEEQNTSSRDNKYAIVKGNSARVYAAFESMMIQIRKSPFLDDEAETIEKICGEKNRGNYFSRAERRKGLVDKLKDNVKLLHFEKGIPKTDEGIEQIVNQCMEFLQKEPWEDGKSWEQVKQERISQQIALELEKRGITAGKALTFIDSMPNGPKGETAEEKRKRAQEHVQSQIDAIKARIGKIFGKEPKVSAIHSTAFTAKRNDEILDEFMRSDNSDGALKVIASVSKFNEGFHPDGINAEFMLKEITENANKAGEPRIVLLQQIRKSNSCRKRWKSSYI